jgi:hypothetical protein
MGGGAAAPEHSSSSGGSGSSSSVDPVALFGGELDGAAAKHEAQVLQNRAEVLAALSGGDGADAATEEPAPTLAPPLGPGSGEADEAIITSAPAPAATAPAAATGGGRRGQAAGTAEALEALLGQRWVRPTVSAGTVSQRSRCSLWVGRTHARARRAGGGGGVTTGQRPHTCGPGVRQPDRERTAGGRRLRSLRVSAGADADVPSLRLAWHGATTFTTLLGRSGCRPLGTATQFAAMPCHDLT